MRPWIRSTLVTLCVIACILLIFYFIVPLIMPFIIGLIIAALIEPFVRLTTKYLRLPRSGAVSLALLICIIAISFCLFAGVGRLVLELDQLRRLLPEYEADISKWLNRQLKVLTSYYYQLPTPLVDSIMSNRDSIYAKALSYIQSIINGMRSLPNVLVTLTVSFLAAYFFSRDKDMLLTLSVKMTPSRFRKRATSLRADVIQSFIGYIRAQIVLMGITTVITVSGLSIIGSRYAWMIGIVSGLLDILPMVGPAAVFVPWSIVAFLLGMKMLSLKLLVILAAAMIIRQLIEAKIVGESIGVHPLLTLMSLYIAVQLFGLSGFILGPVAVIIGKGLITSGIIPIDLR